MYKTVNEVKKDLPNILATIDNAKELIRTLDKLYEKEQKLLSNFIVSGEDFVLERIALTMSEIDDFKQSVQIRLNYLEKLVKDLVKYKKYNI